jgi:sigma-B regulation protein RsbU (phosphoserine phosphatase)
VRLLQSRSIHLAIGVIAVAFSIFAGIDAAKERPWDGTVWLLGRPELEIVDVPFREGVPPSNLQKGDKILGIANQLVNSPADAAAILKQQKPNSTVDYLVERDEGNETVAVQLTVFRVIDRNYIINIILAAIYMGIGFLIYLRSNNERPARLFFLLCLTFGVYFVTNLNRSSYFWGDIISQNGGALARFMLPAYFLQFFLSFPEKKLILTRHPFLSPLVYLLPVMFYVQFTLDQFFGSTGASIRATHWVVLGLYFLLGLIALLHGYFSYRDPIQKERVRLLTLGTLAGVLPFLVFKVGLEELGARSELTHLGVIPLLAIPISFGYCIARYRVMQVDFLFRRSLIYTLVTGSVLLLYLSLVVALGAMILQLSGPTSQLVSVGATLAVAAGLWPVRNRVQRYVDRRFFRARDNLAAILEDFSKEIPKLIHSDTLLQNVGGRLCEILDLYVLGVYQRSTVPEQSSWCLTHRVARNRTDHPLDASHLSNAEDTTSFPPEVMLDATIKLINQRTEPYWIEPPPQTRLDSHLAITREQAEIIARFGEQEALYNAGIALLVPLATQARLVGLLALPNKPTGEDFNLSEIQLLTIISGQVALQIENSRLYEEEVAKQKLEEEMAMARTIQSRLLPREIPTLPGVAIHGMNVSSRQVSGDYYDMIPRQDGKLGIVIADVSGKGMPASLLASNLQAALRAQCDTDLSPGEILERVNRQLHATTDPMHFATLFLCVFDPGTRTLCYSSGGHNAPVLVRSDGQIKLLEKGGLPLGAFEFGSYEEEEVHLGEGDLVFLYTDGLTEAKDPNQEDEYGEDRLNRFLQDHGGLPVNTLIEEVKQEVIKFSGRQEADDDITLVALKILSESDHAVDEAAASQP